MATALALRPEHSPGGEQRRLTYDDLQRLPDDEGLRYELLDGELLVSPAPNLDHQGVVVTLTTSFKLAVPDAFRVLVAPTDWYVCEDTVFEPDLLVVRRSEITDRRRIGAPPVLVVEVLSPSTRSIDQGRKKHRYEREGVEWYWVMDPGVPVLTVFRLRGTSYVEHATVAGDDRYDTDEPFPVTVVPTDLLDR